MNNFQNKKRNIVTAGITFLWYLEMSKVTTVPAGVNGNISTNEIACTSVLKELYLDEGSAEYVEEPNMGAAGVGYQLSINGENILLTPEKDNEINRLMKTRCLVFFQDNHGQWRFIVDALLKSKANTGTFANGKPSYSLQFVAGSQNPAYYYSGSVTINSNRTLSL